MTTGCFRHLFWSCCSSESSTAIMAGTTPHGPPPLMTIQLDLGNSCKCYGCRMKTFRVLNKLPGVRVHCYNLETNQVTLVGAVDPDFVRRKVSRIKKHVIVSAVPLPPPAPAAPLPCPTGQLALLPSAPHNNGPSHPPPPTQRPPSRCSGHTHVIQQGHGKSASCHNAPPPPPHPQPSCHNGPSHPPPPPTQRPPSHRSGHVHVSQQGHGKSASCHSPPPSRHHPQPSCRNGSSHPPPPTQHLHRSQQPPSSPCHCPPSRHSNHNAVHPNNPANQLDNFLHGPSSPLVPRNARNIGILNQLARIPQLKNVELIKKKGVRFEFQSGQVKCCHPISHMEVRPGYDHAAMRLPQHPNGICFM